MREKRQKFVAYYRVSTDKQSKDMPAQKTAVKNYLKDFWPPAKSFKEIESGKSSKNRPELQKALEYCKKHDATLIVAKLDRLSRDLEFIGWIQNSGIRFICADMPQATRETIGFMGVMARWEREQISKRTKEALAEKKKAGVKLGWNNLAARKKIMATKERKKRKRQRDLLKQKQDVKPKPLKKKEKPLSQREIHDLKVAPLLKSLKHQGMTFEKIAQNFNETGAVSTRQGGKWSAMQVFRIYKRLNGHMKDNGK